MTASLNVDEIRGKLVHMLSPSGWSDMLKGFLQSSDLDKLLTYLWEQKEEGKRFTPTIGQMFRAFAECPVDKLKAVTMGQDPYPQLGVADGIPFSCSKTGIEQPSLKYIFNEIIRTVYNGGEYVRDVDLARWSNQGLLMLNKALTVEIDNIGSHYKIWEPFMTYLIDMLNAKKPNMVWVLFGKKAQEMDTLIQSNNQLHVSHPASAAYQKATNWNSEYVFPLVNDILLGQGKTHITW